MPTEKTHAYTQVIHTRLVQRPETETLAVRTPTAIRDLTCQFHTPPACPSTTLFVSGASPHGQRFRCDPLSLQNSFLLPSALAQSPFHVQRACLSSLSSETAETPNLQTPLMLTLSEEQHTRGSAQHSGAFLLPTWNLPRSPMQLQIIKLFLLLLLFMLKKKTSSVNDSISDVQADKLLNPNLPLPNIILHNPKLFY